MEIIITEYLGYCFGVKRALKLTGEVINNNRHKNKKIFTFGSIINNPGVTEELSKKGCFVVIIGNKKHPEVLGIRGYILNKNYMIVEDEKDIKTIPQNKKIGVVIQTTQTKEKLLLITGRLLEKTRELLIYNTICDITGKKQDSTKKLAENTDIMIIVGGKNSANTSHLAEISREINNSTYHIESFQEIKPAWFRNKKRAGISGGASTPVKDLIDVKKAIEN